MSNSYDDVTVHCIDAAGDPEWRLQELEVMDGQFGLEVVLKASLSSFSQQLANLLYHVVSNQLDGRTMTTGGIRIVNDVTQFTCVSRVYVSGSMHAYNFRVPRDIGMQTKLLLCRQDNNGYRCVGYWDIEFDRVFARDQLIHYRLSFAGEVQKTGSENRIGFKVVVEGADDTLGSSARVSSKTTGSAFSHHATGYTYGIGDDKSLPYRDVTSSIASEHRYNGGDGADELNPYYDVSALGDLTR